MIKRISSLTMCVLFLYQSICQAVPMQTFNLCTITSENESNLFSLEVLRKSGSLNGVKLSVGDKMESMVNNNETISITALPGAQVEITNLGDQTMFADCSVT